MFPNPIANGPLLLGQSWCQVAAEAMPANSLIIGVDLAPIKPIPRCVTFQSDINSDKCRASIRQHLKTWKVDTVLHDGAPNVGTAWIQDAFSQAELVLQSLRLATDFLAPGGNFITKIFRSKDYNSLLWVFNQLFGKVEATKPPSSRNVSAEIFVVCREYKAPKHIDSRFLDPKSVFAELADPAPNNEAKVFNPEVKKRKREGYQEGDWTQFKEAPVSEFIQTTDPIAMLGSLNKLSFEQSRNGDVALAAIDKMAETTSEIRSCCADLKVLGRKDFKLLLRWRLKVREKFGFSSKQKQREEASAGEEVAQVESMDEEMRMQEEMQRLKDEADSTKKKQRRKENERKQKEIVRMQMNMTTPYDIGTEQAGPYGEDSMFALKSVDRSGVGNKFAAGRMHSAAPKPEPEEKPSEEEVEDDDEGDNLEEQLDQMYDQYRERRSDVDAKYRAKKARKEFHDDDFEGFSDREEEGAGSDYGVEEDEDSDTSEDEETGDQPLFHRPEPNGKTQTGLSRRAAMYFDQDIFKGIGGLDQSTQDDSGIDMEDSDESKKAPEKPLKPIPASRNQKQASPQPADPKEADQPSEDSDFEVVRNPSARHDEDSWSEHKTTRPKEPQRPDLDIVTAEAMTLAHQLATGVRTRASLLDDAFNKYTLRDTDGLPDWFLDDEDAHSRPQRPVTAAAAAAIREKQRALNARPIKKVREAKARKKMRAARRIEKLRKKSEGLAEDWDMTEWDKATSIARMMAKAAKKKAPRKEVKVVVARGLNRGIAGRPKGTKGRYKMVDARMKKETRAEKRIAKEKKK